MDTLLWYISSIQLAYFVWIWMMIVLLQKTQTTLGRKKKHMEMDETPLERLFPWPRINGPCFPLHQLRSLLRMRRKALRPVVVLFEPVLMVGIQYHLNGLGGKRSLLSTLPHLIYLFCWKIIMCKVSKSKLATICKKVKCWTRKHLNIFTICLHLFAELEWMNFPSASTPTLTNITPLLTWWVHSGNLSGLLILISEKSLTGWWEEETCLTGWMNISYDR